MTDSFEKDQELVKSMKVNRFLLKILRCINLKFTYYRNGLKYPYRGYEAMQFLLENESFNTVLDVGCGEGIQSNIFYENGKAVTAIDYGGSCYFKNGELNEAKWERVVGDVNNYVNLTGNLIVFGVHMFWNIN